MNIQYIVDTIFLSYTLLLFARILSSWFPDWQHHHLIRFIAFYTDPYLNFFRKLLPPLGGVLDISPILAFFVLRIIEFVVHALIP